MHHDRGKLRFSRFILGESPWLGLVDVLVRPADERPDVGEGYGEFHSLHDVLHLADRT
ncbi:hypothetical protein D3C76_1525030 [compost metagenome]